MGQAQNLAMGQEGPGQQSVKIWDGTRDRTITVLLSKSGMGRGTRRDEMGQSLFFLMISCFTTSFPVLEHNFPGFFLGK